MASYAVLVLAKLVSYALLASSIKVKQPDLAIQLPQDDPAALPQDDIANMGVEPFHVLDDPAALPQDDIANMGVDMSTQDDLAIQLPQADTAALPQNGTENPIEMVADQIEATIECGRGFNCGITSKETSEPMSVKCADGEKWFARNAIFIRGRDGKNAVYCSVPKIGTSYIFGVLSELHLAVRGGKRNAGFEAVHEIISAKDPQGLEDLCNAYSFMMIRNPWERMASAYVDKVLTKEVFDAPPSFDNFLKMLAGVENPGEINQHFRPASLTCQTSGEHAMEYDMKIKIEANPREKLERIFVNELSLPRAEVSKVLDTWDEQTHSTKSKGWAKIDKSIDSGLDRVTYYFQKSDPALVAQVYKDDIEFGNYVYGQSGY